MISVGEISNENLKVGCRLLMYLTHKFRSCCVPLNSMKISSLKRTQKRIFSLCNSSIFSSNSWNVMSAILGDGGEPTLEP